MADRKTKLEKVLEKELNSQERSLLQLVSIEQRKDVLVFRMPIGVVTLESLWERIKEIAGENSVTVKQAPVYATLDELDDVLCDIEWLWKNWIPKGFITLLAGDPGIGKTMVALDFARILSDGDCWPICESKSKSRNVIWIDAEAGQQILRQRSINLGIDPKKIFIPVIDGDILGQPNFFNSDHQMQISSMVDATKAEFLVLDSLGGSNRRGENKVEEVRPLLEYLANLARDKNIGIMVLHHLNKGSVGEATEVSLYRIRGSTAIPAFCRSIIAIEPGKSKDELKLRVIKSNLARFSEPLSITSEIDDDGNVKKLSYDVYKPPPPKKTKREKCADWVVKFLEAEGSMPLAELIKFGDSMGYTRNTIYSAKDLLGDMITVSGTGREAHWELSSQNDEESIQAIMEARNGE